MSQQTSSVQPIDNFLNEVINRGAYTGVLAACDRITTSSQVQNLLAVAGAYTGQELYPVLTLYVLYKMGRNAIGRQTGDRLLKDLKWIHDTYNSLSRRGSPSIGFDEVVRKYLGAVKWIYTAIQGTKSYHICRSIRRGQLSINEILGMLVSSSP